MAATTMFDDLDAYVNQYGNHGALQRLQFIAQTVEDKNVKIDANKMCLDLLKRTTNWKLYSDVHASLKELVEGSDSSLPAFDNVWVEATQKQASILKDLYEQDLHQAKSSQAKDSIRNCHTQLTNLYMEQGDYFSALKFASMSREYCNDPQEVFATCMTIIQLNALLRQYTDIQSFASKGHHTPFKSETHMSKIYAAYGLAAMAAGRFKDAATNFIQVKPQELGSQFADLICAQDLALYGVLCALASFDRSEIQSKLLDSSHFRECLDLVPQIRDVTIDFCNCRYSACLAALERFREPLILDVHLHGVVSDILQHIRCKGIVQYFAPFLSVSLHSMATAFNTAVDKMQAEVALLIQKGDLDAKIDSQNKILHVRHANQRNAAFQNTMRVSTEFVETTEALVLRMNLLKRDFGVHVGRKGYKDVSR